MKESQIILHLLLPANQKPTRAIDRVVHHSVILDMMSEESYRAEVANQHHLSEETGSGLLNRNQ